MTGKQLPPVERDAELIRVLSRLPLFSPSRGFADRVMARVTVPKPVLVLAVGRARAWAFEPRRALVLAGSYAASAVIALGLVVPWLYTNSPAISFAANWALGRALAAVRELGLAAAGWAVSSGLSDVLEQPWLAGGRLWVILATLTVAYAGCAFGLRYLLRAPRGKDAGLPVSL